MKKLFIATLPPQVARGSMAFRQPLCEPCSIPLAKPKERSSSQAAEARAEQLLFSEHCFPAVTFYLWQVKLPFPILMAWVSF